MTKYFNTEGPCYPQEHYMVSLDKRILEIKKLIDNKKYFSINRGRQYGKTTTLDMIQEKLRDDYVIFYISFEGISEESFQNENAFCRLFAGLLYDTIDYGEVSGIGDSIKQALENMSRPDTYNADFRLLSNLISTICRTAEKPVILMIDEVDQAGNQQIFLSFLGMLRNKYLKMKQRPTFQSVILAGVYDIRNLKLKIRTDQEHQKNSPWNIAAEFNVNMGFDARQIQEMLLEYEQEHHTGMNIEEMAELLYAYTSGYPFLVSRLCKIIDERIPKSPDFSDKFAAWTKEGFLEAIKLLSYEKNTLFESLANKLRDYPELREMLHAILFTGEKIPYHSDNHIIDIASMFGFIRNDEGNIVVSNRIFETRLYNLFISEEVLNSAMYKAASTDKDRNYFIRDGKLDMELVLERFVETFTEIYSDAEEKFVEENGRRFFLLYLKPIINGTGNFYIEARTRNMRRTDVIIDYRGQQIVCELKIWRGQEYNRRGEEQLLDYLDAYHLTTGYMLSFNFNKKKKTGVQKIRLEGKLLIEAVV